MGEPSAHIAVPSGAAQVMELLERAGYEAYIVGGCVRDVLLGREPADFDITTSARPEQVKAVMDAAGVATADTGLAYGTVSVLYGGAAYETTTYRADGAYTDGRHPDSVELLSSIEGDLARRDFTVNAMAYRPGTGLVDLFGGREDLVAGTLRSVGCAHERFEEDALRIMRGVRFAAQLGFAVEPVTADAMHADAGLLSRVSAERLAAELLKLVCAPHALAPLLEFADVLAVFMPEIEASIGFEQHNVHHVYTVWEHCARTCCAAPADDAAMRLAALMHDIGKPSCFAMGADGQGHFYGHREASAELFSQLAARLKLPRALARDVGTLVRYHDAALPSTQAGWRRWAVKFGPEGVARILELHRYDIAALAPAEVEAGLAGVDAACAAFEQAIADVRVFSVADLAIDGNDVMAAGVEAGPAVGRVLSQLLDDVVAGTLANERAALLARAAELA